MQNLLTREMTAAPHPPWCDPATHLHDQDGACVRVVGRAEPELGVNVEALSSRHTGDTYVVLWVDGACVDGSVVDGAASVSECMTSDRAREIALRLIDAADMIDGKRTLTNGGLHVPGSGPIKLGWVA